MLMLLFLPASGCLEWGDPSLAGVVVKWGPGVARLAASSSLMLPLFVLLPPPPFGHSCSPHVSRPSRFGCRPQMSLLRWWRSGHRGDGVVVCFGWALVFGSYVCVLGWRGRRRAGSLCYYPFLSVCLCAFLFVALSLASVVRTSVGGAIPSAGGALCPPLSSSTLSLFAWWRGSNPLGGVGLVVKELSVHLLLVRRLVARGRGTLRGGARLVSLAPSRRPFKLLSSSPLAHWAGGCVHWICWAGHVRVLVRNRLLLLCMALRGGGRRAGERFLNRGLTT